MKNFKITFGFTLAEVLITLAIIGVVCAMTIPTLVKSHQKQTVVTSLQKFNSTMQQAIKLSEADNGQIETWDFPTDSSTVTFLNTYIIPYLNVAQKCELATTTACWNTVYEPNGTDATATGDLINYSYTNTWMAKYVLQDGSELGFFGNGTGFFQVLVDINGAKKPNTMGNDVFAFLLVQKSTTAVGNGNGTMLNPAFLKIGGFYPDGYGIDNNTLINYQYRGCSKDINYHTAGSFCSAKIMNDGWQINSDYPFFN